MVRKYSLSDTPSFCSYVIPCPACGALVAPKTCDLQVVASPPFLHVAAGHPSLRSGERYFLSGSDHAAGLGTPAVFRISPLAVSPLTRCLQAISDTKVDRRILPANEPANYFPAALRVKKLTPALPGHPEVIFSKIIVRTLVVPGTPDPVYRSVAALLWILCDLSQRICICRSRQPVFISKSQRS